jgi:hypothetical protein
MKLRKSLIGIVAVLVLVLAACSPEGPAADPDGGAAVIETEYQALMVELEAGGAQVEQVGAIEQPTIGADARQVNINGFPVQVFIFPDEQARLSVQQQLAQEPSLIPETGGLSNGSQVWVWGDGRLMVIHVGMNQGVIDPLTDALGEPVLILESGAVG